MKLDLNASANKTELTTKITKDTKKIEEIVLKPLVNFVSFVVIHIKPQKGY